MDGDLSYGSYLVLLLVVLFLKQFSYNAAQYGYEHTGDKAIKTFFPSFL